MEVKVKRPSVILWPQKPGIDGMYEQIERCGRICYRSAVKGGESAKAFAHAMETSGHTAMLEHGTVYLTIPVVHQSDEPHAIVYNKYSKSNRVINRATGEVTDYVTSNYRVLFENGWTNLLEYWSEPTGHHERRLTAMFDTNIGITREFNRHRVNSMAESSTRYCNYTKDKFGNAISVIEPAWLRDRSGVIQLACQTKDYKEYLEEAYLGYNGQWEKLDYWLFAAETSNFCYNNLISLGCKPQEAREVLGLMTNSQLIHTAFIDDWKHFLALRAEDTPTNHPHPMALELASELKRLMTENQML